HCSQKTKGHGWSPVALDLRSPRAACPWHPTRRYVADAPGRPGSAMRISPSDSTRDVICMMQPTIRDCIGRVNTTSSPRRGRAERLGAKDERLDAEQVVEHRLVRGELVVGGHGPEDLPVALVRACRATGRAQRF